MKRWQFSTVMLWVGLVFLYLPMLILVIYSFNASKLVTVWGDSHLSGMQNFLKMNRFCKPFGQAFVSRFIAQPWRSSLAHWQRSS